MLNYKANIIKSRFDHIVSIKGKHKRKKKCLKKFIKKVFQLTKKGLVSRIRNFNKFSVNLSACEINVNISQKKIKSTNNLNKVNIDNNIENKSENNTFNNNEVAIRSQT
jgi:hypothetical protein